MSIRQSSFGLGWVLCLLACARAEDQSSIGRSPSSSGGSDAVVGSSGGDGAAGGISAAGGAPLTGNAGAPASSAGGTIGTAGAFGSAGMSTSGGSAGSFAAGGTTSGVAGALGGSCVTARADGSAPLIDDLSGNLPTLPNNEGRTGGWYTYGDSEISIMPAIGSPFRVSNGAATITGTSQSCGTCWGGGMGVPFDQTGASPCPYDASIYTGIRITYHSSVPFRLRIVSTATLTSFNDFGQQMPAAGTATTVEVAFSEARQQDKGSGVPATRLDPTQLIGLQFEVGPNLTNFSVGVTQLSFY